MDAPENYDILNNPIYQDRFDFTDIHFRNADYEDSIVKLILFFTYLGYIKKGVPHLKRGENDPPLPEGEQQGLEIDFNRDIAKVIKDGQKAHAKEVAMKKK